MSDCWSSGRDWVRKGLCYQWNYYHVLSRRSLWLSVRYCLRVLGRSGRLYEGTRPTLSAQCHPAKITLKIQTQVQKQADTETVYHQKLKHRSAKYK